MPRQYDKQHATTVVATAPLKAHRFVAFDGGYVTVAGGLHACCGITETAAAEGEAVSVVTSYSYLVESGAAFAAGALLKPSPANPTPAVAGRAIEGSSTDHCARALVAATAAGQLVPVVLLPHVQA